MHLGRLMGSQHICCSNWMGNCCSTSQGSMLPACMDSSCRCCLGSSQFGMDRHLGIPGNPCNQGNQCIPGIRYNLGKLCYRRRCYSTDKLLQNCTGMHQQHQRMDIQRNQCCKDKLLRQDCTGKHLKFISFMY